MTPEILEPARELFVWVWLPNATKSVVAGRLELVGETHQFIYTSEYLKNSDAISLYRPELPLQAKNMMPSSPTTISGCLRDACPDFWGRRVIINYLSNAQVSDVDALDEMNFMLHSGSDRIGALDFQASDKNYDPRPQGQATLDMLLEASGFVEKGLPLPTEMRDTLRFGVPFGGARPKAHFEDGNTKYIAKFSTANDQHSVIKGEYIAMKMAKSAGLDVSAVQLRSASGRDVLLIERFDRVTTKRGETRRAMVSGLTMMGLAEHEARYASYPLLADELRARSKAPDQDMKELFSRMCFNILVGNTDDHARNHAAFWDGSKLSLTPAYDIDPRPRMSHEANQAMSVSGNSNRSQLSLAIEAAAVFGLSEEHAKTIINNQIEAIRDLFPGIAKDVDLSHSDYTKLWGQAILREYAFDGYHLKSGCGFP